MTVMPWRWSALVLLLANVGCQTTPPSAPNSGDGDVETTWPAREEILQAALVQAEDSDWCDGFFEPEVATEGSEVYMLGDRALVEVLCAHTAYQSVYVYAALSPDGTLEPLTLDMFYPDDGGNFQRVSEPSAGGLADFNPEQGQLTIFSKARGLGDCGSLATYRWTGQALNLETYRYQACTDVPQEPQTAPNPENFPQVYP